MEYRKNAIDKFPCTLFCHLGQNEPDIMNLRLPKEVRENNRHKAVIEYTFIISQLYHQVKYNVMDQQSMLIRKNLQ